MAKYFFTAKAIEDLSNIWDYTYDEWSETQADKYYRLLINTCLEITKNQNIGKSYIQISTDIKGYSVGKHIIFYRVTKTKIEITRILHQKMDLKSRFIE